MSPPLVANLVANTGSKHRRRHSSSTTRILLRYRHWKLSFDGPTATLAMDVDEDGGIRPGYKLKLNSYDLGVDIELHDALQRIRFEHPEVRAS